MNAQLKPASNSQYLKVLSDGSQVPASDPRIDHVAVLDTTRNLLIYVNSIGVNGKAAPSAKVKEAVEKLDVLGGGWQMASRKEAESIIDDERFDPCVDPNLFPGIKPRGHWTRTPYKPAPASAAWWVGFYYGGVDVGGLGGGGFALAVRPAGQ